MEKRRNISLEAMEENDDVKKPNSFASKFDAKNYLNVKLSPTEDSKELRIRLLPIDKDSNVAFKEAHMHTIMLNEAQVKAFTPANGKVSKWKSYICLEKEDDVDHSVYGKKCPFCELQRDAYNKKVEAEKDAIANGINPKEDVDVQRYQTISLSNKANEVGICRCIERGAEADGPKFWKMPKDAIAQIKTIARDRKLESIGEAKEDNNGVLPDDFEPVNIYDLYTGHDLKITIKRKYDKNNKPTDKTEVTVTDFVKPRPLSTSEEQIDAWIDDEKKWTDVFVVKDYDYLSIIAEGEVPFFDKEQHKWVIRENKNSYTDKSEENNKIDKEIQLAESRYKDYEDDFDVPENEDLPF